MPPPPPGPLPSGPWRNWPQPCGTPGKGGITGGAIFSIWLEDTDICNNRFLTTKTAPDEHFYGIKVREGKRACLHHNTIGANFSIEFPFENDQDVEKLQAKPE